MMKKRIIMIVIVLCLQLALNSCVFPENESRNIELGNNIVVALYEYQQIHSQFPEQLKDLTPDYLGEIPKTSGGRDFFYRIDKFHGFLLVFQIDSRFGCGIDELTEWECSYGD